jgi:hypothetical protein
MADIAQTAEGLGRQAHRHPWFDTAIRAGLVAYGVVHLLVGWVALQLAFGDRKESASSKGAMKQLAEQPFGTALLWLVGIGMFVLVLWRLLDALFGHWEHQGAKRWWKRAVDVLKAVIYGAIGLSAITIATGNGSSGGGADSWTKKLMDLPAGQWIVSLVGLAIIAYGANYVRQAWNEDFRKKISADGEYGQAGRAYIWFGKAGYNAKGVALAVVGGLFAWAGITHEAKKSGGLDRALRTVLEQPFGPFLLALIAIGIGCYGFFCFARARHLAR